jgi:methylmalonyl-CoA/ethylmalonyl-CoA epimerase
MIGRLDHIGVATSSIERSIAVYRELLGATEIGAPFDLPAQKVRLCFPRHCERSEAIQSGV